MSRAQKSKIYAESKPGAKARVYTIDGLPSCMWDELTTPPVVRAEKRQKPVGGLAISPFWKRELNVGKNAAPLPQTPSPPPADRCLPPTGPTRTPLHPLAPVSPIKKPSPHPLPHDNLNFDLDTTTSPEEILLDCGVSVSPRALRASDIKRRKNRQLYEERTLELQLGEKERRIQNLCGNRRWVKEWEGACTLQRAARVMFAKKELAYLKQLQEGKSQTSIRRRTSEKKLRARHQEALTEYDRRATAGHHLQRVGWGYLARKVTMLHAMSCLRSEVFVTRSLAATTVTAFMRAKLSSGLVAAMLRDKLVEAFSVFNTSAAVIQHRWRWCKQRDVAAQSIQTFWHTQVEVRQRRRAQKSRLASHLKHKNHLNLVYHYYTHMCCFHATRKARKATLVSRADSLYVKTRHTLTLSAFARLRTYCKASKAAQLATRNMLRCLGGSYKCLHLYHLDRRAAIRRGKSAALYRRTCERTWKAVYTRLLVNMQVTVITRLRARNRLLLAARYFRILRSFCTAQHGVALEAKVALLQEKTHKAVFAGKFKILALHTRRAAVSRMADHSKLITVRRYYRKLGGAVVRRKQCKSIALEAKNKGKVLKRCLLRWDGWCMAEKLSRKNIRFLLGRYYTALVEHHGAKQVEGGSEKGSMLTESLSDASDGEDTFPALQTLFSLAGSAGYPSLRKLTPTSAPLPVPPPPLEDLSAVSLTNVDFVEALLMAADTRGAHYPMLEMYFEYLRQPEVASPSPPKCSLAEECAAVRIQRAWRGFHVKAESAVKRLQRAWRCCLSKDAVGKLREMRLEEYRLLRLEGVVSVLQPVGRGCLERRGAGVARGRGLAEEVEGLERYHSLRARRCYWTKWAEFAKGKDAGFESQNSTVLHSARSFPEVRTVSAHQAAPSHLRTLRYLRCLHEVALQREADIEQ